MKIQIFLLLSLSIMVNFGLYSCERTNKKTSNPDSPKSIKMDTLVHHENLNEKYDFNNFHEFYEKLRESLRKNSEIEKLCSFPFNENISKEKFHQNEIITEDAKNIIFKVYPEQSGEKYIIDNDSFFIQFEKNKNGYWKLKSIDRSY